MLAGTVVMSAWGGTRRRVYSLLGAGAIGGLFIMVLGLRPSIPLTALGGFGIMFTMPIVTASSQAIWQTRVEPDVQGRVFSIRMLIAWFVNPVAMLVVGPLADFVLEPAMRVGGALSGTFGWLVGTGPGAGIGLILVFSGLLATLVSLGGYAIAAIRNVESILPDHT